MNLFTAMYVFVPAALVMHAMHADPTWVFVVAALGIIPLAKLMGDATEHLSAKTGPGIGGLLNATFGNATELIIALIALEKGMHDIVRASITGSIIGNILFVLGAAMVAGGIKRTEQTFDVRGAGVGIGMLVVATVGIAVPTLFHHLVPQAGIEREHSISLAVSIVFFVCYALYMVFSLKTHKDLFAGEHFEEELDEGSWSMKRSIITLFCATIAVALVSEALIGSVEHTAKAWGLTDLFVGVFLLAVIGNAAEHSTAILVAMKNRMELAFQIAVGSSIQLALLIAPILVFTGYFLGNPMDLVFQPLEAAILIASVLIVWASAMDGKSNWMEGVLLLGIYAICGVAFYYHP